MSISIVKASPHDAPTVLALMQEFYVFEHLVFDPEKTGSAVRQLLGKPELGAIFLIRNGQGSVGYLVLTYGYSLEYHGRTLLLDELYLQAQARGLGAGKVALQFAEQLCRDAGVPTLHLVVDRANLPAQEVYRKGGFKEQGRFAMFKWV